MIYKFEKGKTFRGLEAQIVGEELERIRIDAGGELLTEQVVQQAQIETNPLHKAFTWDLEKAARVCWGVEARELIRSVMVQVTPDSAPIHAFIHTTVKVISDDGSEPGTQPVYQACHVILDKPDQYASALSEAGARLSAAQRGFDELQRLAPTRKQERRIVRARKHVEKAREILTPATV